MMLTLKDMELDNLALITRACHRVFEYLIATFVSLLLLNRYIVDARMRRGEIVRFDATMWLLLSIY